MSIDFESTSTTRSGERLHASFNCWMGTPGGHELMQKMIRKLENAQQIFNVRSWIERLLVGKFRFAAKIASGMNSWASITSEWYPYQRWQKNYCVEPRRGIGRQRNAGMIKCNLLRRKFSIHDGFRRPSMRRGILMRKVLYSGAWNADVWMHLFPMSLADRSFDSDGNCVCVCCVDSIFCFYYAFILLFCFRTNF